jgi:glycosyltransferase involved in cell wall biosynthesis
MEILFVTPFYKPSYVYGGPTRSIPSLCEGLVQNSCDVTVFTTNACGSSSLEVDTGEKKVVDGVDVFYFAYTNIAGRFFFSYDLLRACYKYVHEFDYVYIYGIWNFPAIAAGWVCRRKSVPYIVSPRTGLMEWPLQQSWLRKKLYLWLFGQRYLDGAWAMHYTTKVEQRESEQIGIESKGFVVPNCMDFSEFDTLPNSGRFRKKIGLPSDVSMLLFLGRLEPRKGIDLSLRAFAQTRDRLPDAHFVVAGPGDERYLQELQALTEELGIVDAVSFPGYVNSDTRLEALVDADAFILTSHTENFAMAAVEAMASGTPVVLSKEVGVAEKAECAGAGTTVALDQSAVAEKVSKILGSSSLREEMGDKGPIHVRETYGREAVAAQMMNVIEEHEAVDT